MTWKLTGRPLLRDVAESANVSVTTVSLVLNGKAGASIPGETQARVQAAARELGYRPNFLARGLRRRKSDTFGFISDEIATTPFAGAMIQGAQDAAWEAGIVLLLVNTGRDRAIEARALEIMLERQVDAVIYATMYHQVIDLPEAVRLQPAVLLDARAADESLPSVVPDERGAATTAVERLIAAGHERIGFITTSERVPAAIERLDSYRSTLAAHGLGVDERLIAQGPDGDTLSGEQAAFELLDRPDRPSAVFCFNDRMAMGTYRAARKRGLRVPDDLSVVGFDNQEVIAPALDPGLTTMALPHYEMGRWAVEYLVRETSASNAASPDGNHAPGPRPAPVQYRMPCQLVERASVAQWRHA